MTGSGMRFPEVNLEGNRQFTGETPDQRNRVPDGPLNQSFDER